MNSLIFARHINLAPKGFKNITQVSLRCYSIGSNNICRKTSSTTCFGTVAKYNFGIGNCFSLRTSFKALRNFSSQNELPSNIAKMKNAESHGSNWVLERLVSIALLVIFPAAYFERTPAIDTIIVFFTGMHVYWGLEAIVKDYVRPAVFGNVIPKFNTYYVLIPMLFLLAMLLTSAHEDRGITQITKQLWNLKTRQELIDLENKE